MSHKRIIVALSIAAVVGCSNTEHHSVNDPSQQPAATTAKTSAPGRETPRTMAEDDSKPWRSDPDLSGRFHPGYPDDLQVIIHDGGPRFTDKTPELVWVTVSGKHKKAYRGKVLNQPHGVTSAGQGDEILFLAVVGAEHPFQVSEKYLAERDNWVIVPCTECSFPELFDAPSDLLKKVFPNVGENSAEETEAFTSFCPMCGGVQVIHKPGLEGAQSSDISLPGKTIKTSDGRMRFVVTTDAPNLLPLESGVTAIEEPLKTDRWLVLVYSIHSTQDLTVAYKHSPNIARSLADICHVAVRPTRSFEDVTTWLPEFVQDSSAGPLWLLLVDGKLVSSMGGASDVVELRKFVSNEPSRTHR